MSSRDVSYGAYPWGYFILEASLQGNPDAEAASLKSAKIAIVPRRSLGQVRFLRIYYLRKVNNMVADTDRPDIPGSEDYLVDYAKWKVAQVDPQRSSDIYMASYKELEMSLLESYSDRTPEEGGQTLRVSGDTVARFTNPAEYL